MPPIAKPLQCTKFLSISSFFSLVDLTKKFCNKIYLDYHYSLRQA